ncbi:hypothetical protein LEN26_005337, partial [Aphanomyces euteiches]
MAAVYASFDGQEWLDFILPADDGLLNRALGIPPAVGQSTRSLSKSLTSQRAKKRVNLLREELAALQHEKKVLEAQLALIRSKHKSKCRRLSFQEQKWQRIAQKQYELKLRAEREHDQLSATLAEQMAMKREMEAVLFKKPRLMVILFYNAHGCIGPPARAAAGEHDTAPTPAASSATGPGRTSSPSVCSDRCPTPKSTTSPEDSIQGNLPIAPLLAFDTNATAPTTPTTTSQSLGNHTDLLINVHEPPPPSLTAQADKPLPACQALHPPVPPSPTNPSGSWLDEPYLQANSPARPFREHQHQRLFPLFQRTLPILFPLFTSPSHTLSASPTSHQPILQSDASMPPTSTPPLAQAPPEQNQAAATSTPQPAASLPSLTEPRTIISMESYQKRKRDEDLNSTTAKRVAPTIALVAAPSTLAFPQPAPTTTHAPTDTRTMADTHQDTDMQATEPQGSSQNQQPAGASPSPKRPGLEEIRDECHPPVPYANDSLFWEAEDELFP